MLKVLIATLVIVAIGMATWRLVELHRVKEAAIAAVSNDATMLQAQSAANTVLPGCNVTLATLSSGSKEFVVSYLPPNAFPHLDAFLGITNQPIVVTVQS